MPAAMAPFTPPVEFPKTSSATHKKNSIIGGTTATNYKTKTIEVRMPATVADTKPIKTAFGAYGNTTGQSSAGIAFEQLWKRYLRMLSVSRLSSF